MAAAFTFAREDTWDISIDVSANLAALGLSDINGLVFTLRIKDSLKDDTTAPALTHVHTVGTELGPGLTAMTVPSDVTALIPAGSYEWDIVWEVDPGPPPVNKTIAGSLHAVDDVKPGKFLVLENVKPTT